MFYPDNISSGDYNQKWLWLRQIRGEYPSWEGENGFDIELFKENL